MDDELDVDVQDLTADEICELLAEAGVEIGPDQAEQLARFVAAAGSLDDALAALGLPADEP